jgi:hypothetical protein
MPKCMQMCISMCEGTCKCLLICLSHYRKWCLCQEPNALCKGTNPLGKDFAESPAGFTFLVHLVQISLPSQILQDGRI